MHPYGGEKNVRRNLFLYIIDDLSFVSAMALISITTVIPFFLEQLEVSTLQMAIVTSLALVCTFVTHPFFGAIASRAKKCTRHLVRYCYYSGLSFLRLSLLFLCLPLITAC